ncbi:MAG: hypothetical protein WBC78_07535 [Candidatus Sulfotelmatobacter sp.]
MNRLFNLFSSPELYPLKVDFARQVIRFVRMSEESYRHSVFLDTRTRSIGDQTYEIRLDDILLAAATQSRPGRIHYIFHTTFCCSTLLARYFELLPSCLVLKEPMLLTQLALTSVTSVRCWEEVFDVCVRLLARVYTPHQTVIIKPHEPCNALGEKLLGHDNEASVTFLHTSLRSFLLSILKSDERRLWVRNRLRNPVEIAAYPGSDRLHLDNLTDSEAAAYLWLLNCFLCKQLSSGKYRSRVLVINGERVADSAGEVVSAIAALCQLNLDFQQLERLLTHSSAGKYSKDLSKSYDANSRRQEMAELEIRFGAEADRGESWAEHFCSLHGLPLQF